MRLAFLLALFLLCGGLGNAASAQDFPVRPVTLIVPWPAGGATDVQLRALAAATEKHLGQPIVIENRPGAAGTLAPVRMAETEKPDGYTISQIPIGVFRVPLVRRTAFDPATDLTYIIQLSGYTFGVAVRGDAPWKSFQGLIDDARASPGKISYGTSGVGGTPHLTMETIARQKGLRWTHVPFNGGAAAINGLLGGHVQAAADGSGWAPQVEAGQFRLLVTWGARRSKNWPAVPTLREVGIDLVANAPFGIAGPKGMDARIVKILHDAFKLGLDEPSSLAAMAAFDQEPAYLNSRDYREFALRQVAEQKRMIEALGLDRE